MTHPAALAADEQRAHERLRTATATLAARAGLEVPRERTKDGRAVERAECLAVMAEAMVRLTGELDERKAAGAAARSER